MKRISKQNDQVESLDSIEENVFPQDDQNRFILVVNDALELLYSSANAKRQLRLPKIGEKISAKDIVHESEDPIVYNGVRAALSNQQIQCYKGLQIAADPMPIAAKLTFDTYPSNATLSKLSNRVVVEWFPLEEEIEVDLSSVKMVSTSEEKTNKRLLSMEKYIAQLEAEMTELARENAKLRVFAMSASHDLRNPLMTWQYSMELIGQYNTKERRAEARRDGRRAVKRFETLLNLLDELIYDEKIRQGRAKEQDMDAIIKTVLFLLELDVNHCQACVDIDFSKKTKFHFPKAFIAIILHNLLSNACKYRDKDRQLKIKVSTEEIGDEVLLKISDNGIGMSKEVIQTYLFQAFARPTQSQQGRGLGLHIVKSVVEQSGGQIEVKSEEGKGSTFYIKLKPYLPLRGKKSPF